MKMKKVIIATLLFTSFFSCKENKDTAEVETKQIETEKKESNSPKFRDTNGCSQYANLYEALPHIDTYKNLSFGELNCMEIKEKSTFSKDLNVNYFDNKTKTSIKIHIYEISGESKNEELNLVNMAKTSFNTYTKFAGQNVYKSKLNTFENASIKIFHNESEKELSTATFLATYKDKYSLWIDVEMLGKIDAPKVDELIKEYLEAIKKDALN